MNRYEITWSQRVCYAMTVQADTIDDAIEKARSRADEAEETDYSSMDDMSVELVKEGLSND